MDVHDQFFELLVRFEIGADGLVVDTEDDRSAGHGYLTHLQLRVQEFFIHAPSVMSIDDCIRLLLVLQYLRYENHRVSRPGPKAHLKINLLNLILELFRQLLVRRTFFKSGLRLLPRRFLVVLASHFRDAIRAVPVLDHFERVHRHALEVVLGKHVTD